MPGCAAMTCSDWRTKHFLKHPKAGLLHQAAGTFGRTLKTSLLEARGLSQRSFTSRIKDMSEYTDSEGKTEENLVIHMLGPFADSNSKEVLPNESTVCGR
jgi:hypothetical protein